MSNSLFFSLRYRLCLGWVMVAGEEKPKRIHSPQKLHENHCAGLCDFPSHPCPLGAHASPLSLLSPHRRQMVP